MIKVLIVDDHKTVRNGIKDMLRDSDGIEVIDAAESGDKALHILKEKEIDIILMDIKMPGKNGIATTKEITKKYPTVKIIACSMFYAKSNIIDMFKAGASGYLLKTTQEEEINRAIEEVYGGSKYFSSEVSSVMLTSLLSNVSKSNSKNVLLSKRESEILVLIKKGLTNDNIGSQLDISHRTVEKHRQNIFAKCGVNSTVELITMM